MVLQTFQKRGRYWILLGKRPGERETPPTGFWTPDFFWGCALHVEIQRYLWGADFVPRRDIPCQFCFVFSSAFQDLGQLRRSFETRQMNRRRAESKWMSCFKGFEAVKTDPNALLGTGQTRYFQPTLEFKFLLYSYASTSSAYTNYDLGFWSLPPHNPWKYRALYSNPSRQMNR